jgi:soluble lytic murein transglycosylase-like protein
MAPLAPATAAIALVVAAPACAASLTPWRPYIAEASVRFGVPQAWIEQVMRAESNGQTMLGGRPIRSSAGAIGLMQLMPPTWQAMRRTLNLGADPDDPRDNILAGTFYLRMMFDRFGYPGLFAAYNAGPTRYALALKGRPLPRETRDYLAVVAGSRPPASQGVAAAGGGLFVALSASPQATDQAAPESPLFVLLRTTGRVP